MSSEFSRRTILLVDDDPTMRSVVASALRAAGCQQVLQASDGEQALQVVRSSHIDLLVCDCQMAPMDGLTFLRRLRELPEGRDRRVVMLTASNRPEDAWIGRELRVSAWLVKPINPQMVVKRIAAVLGFGFEGELPADTLAELAEAYERRLPNEVATLESLAGRFTLRPGEFEANCVELSRRLHVVKGQAGTLGYALLGAVAGQLDDVLREAERDPAASQAMRGDILKLVSSVLAVMRVIVDRKLRGGAGTAGVKVLEDLAGFAEPLRARLAAAADATEAEARARRDRVAGLLHEADQNRVVNERRIRVHQSGTSGDRTG
jgi:two-component system chemotaxis response regulator CheY